jgi:hypothetical protein
MPRFAGQPAMIPPSRTISPPIQIQDTIGLTSKRKRAGGRLVA